MLSLDRFSSLHNQSLRARSGISHKTVSTNSLIGPLERAAAGVM
jgi:hypothetical protein